MLASRLLRASRPSAMGIGLGRTAATRKPLTMASVPARLLSSIRTCPSKRPSILQSTSAQRSCIISLASSARFNSTTSSANTPTPPTSTTTGHEFEPFDSVSPLDFTSLTETPKAITEHIGFLKELGLDFGWGPTACMQWLLEHVHIWSGQPWWASIVIATLVIRIIQLPGYLKLSDMGAKMKEVEPFVQPAMQRLKLAQKDRDMAAMHHAKKELNDVYKTAGVNRMWIMFPLAQIPVFYGFYNVLKSMAQVPVPGFLEGGIFWFSNLSIADPFFLLPLISSGSMSYLFSLGGETGNTAMSPQLRKGLMIGLPLLSLLFMWNWPAAMTVYFATSSLFGLGQALALRSPRIREALGLYPIVRPEPPAKPSLVVIDPNSVPQTNSGGNVTSRMKEMLGSANATPIAKGVSNWLENNAKGKKHSSYNDRRKEEEAEKRRAVVEAKRRRAMRNEV